MESDEEAIAYFTDLAGDGVRIDYSTDGNPFRFKVGDELFQDRQQTNQRLKLEHESTKKFTLIQRTEMTRPHVPPCETRATLIHSSQSGRQRPFSSISSLSRRSINSQIQSDTVSNTQSQSKDGSTTESIESALSSLPFSKRKGRIQNQKFRPKSVQSKRSSRKNNNIKINIENTDNSSSNDKSINLNLPGSLDLLLLSPLSSSRTTTLDSSRKTASQDQQQQPRKRERKLTMHEFVDEKREIYRLQLFIDKKNKDISNFSRNIETNNRRLQETETKIKNLSDQYKMTSIQIEAAVARSRKLADAAARETSLRKKELLRYKANCDMLESDIIKKEALLESYQLYKQFLTIFVPENSTIENYFTSPKILIDELEKIETDNLFIIQECDHIIDNLKRLAKSVKKELKTTDELSNAAIERLESIEKVEPSDFSLTQAQEKSMNEMEDELYHISELIKKTYFNCLSHDTDIKPITMLERIENKLEKMYMLLVYVDPEFIEEKQAIKLRIRRDLQRKLKQEKQELEQKLKTEQAIERAKKPIPQKVGRPVNQRIIPIKAKIHDDEKEKAKLREIERERNLLYGEIE